MSKTKHIVLLGFINTKKKFTGAKIKIVFLLTLSTQGNKISHQNQNTLLLAHLASAQV